MLLGLRLETTSTSKPDLVISFQIPFDAGPRIFHLTQSCKTEVDFVEAAEGAVHTPSNAIARLVSSNGSALLASLVDGCSVETAVDSRKTIPLPTSSVNEWHYLNLRPNDTIHFQQHSFTCIETQQSVETVPTQYVDEINAQSAVEKIQVESSVPKYDSTDDGVDEELVRSITAHANHQHRPESPDDTMKKEHQVFSTAREGSVAHDQVHTMPPQHSSAAGVPRHGRLHRSSTVQQVLETPVKHKAKLPKHYMQTPVLLQLEAADKENQSGLEKQIASSIDNELENVTQDSSLPHSRQLPQPLNSSLKRKHVTSATNAEEAQAVQQKRKKRRHPPPPPSLPAKRIETHDFDDDLDNTLPTTILMTSSKYKDDVAMHRWLQKQGCEVAKDIPSDLIRYTCVVGDDALPRTSKLLRSVARGARIVSDTWLSASYEADELLALEDFQPAELRENADQDRHKLLAGKAVFVTSTLHAALKGGWKEFESLIYEAGAIAVDHGSARRLRDWNPVVETIFIGAGPHDSQAQHIMQQLGRKIYNKDLLKESVVQGRLLIEDKKWQIDFSALAPSDSRKAKKK